MSKTTEAISGSRLKHLDYRYSLTYKGERVKRNVLDENKNYVVNIYETEDSEGWIHTRYEVEDGYPELEEMLSDMDFERKVQKEIDQRQEEYYNKRRKKLMEMPHEKLVDKIIELQKDITWRFERVHL